MPCNAGIFASLDKKFWGQIKRADPCPCPRGCHRDDAGTSTHIEHRLVRPDAGKADEMSRDGCRERGRGRESGPGLALLALEIHERIVAHWTSPGERQSQPCAREYSRVTVAATRGPVTRRRRSTGGLSHAQTY